MLAVVADTVLVALYPDADEPFVIQRSNCCFDRRDLELRPVRLAAT